MSPMSNAERQKRYRERLKQNPIKYEEMRRKHLERIKFNKLKIKDQNQSQKEKTRQKWREYSNRYYEKKKNKSITDDLNIEKKPKEPLKSWKFKTMALRKELKNYSNALKLSLKKQETMRKQIYRLRISIKKIKYQTLSQGIDDDQPSKLSEFDILSESLRSVYKESTNKERTIIKRIAHNSLTKKYRVATKIGQTIGIKGRIRTKMSLSTKRNLLIRQIHNFYLRDDISRATAGKKECKTKGKTKMQIRFLTDSILNLFQIFKREGGKASYSTLVRHRPFYVLPPKLHNRDTCACKRHANISFKISKLYRLQLLKTNKIEELLNDIACNLELKECMYGHCQVCAKRNIKVNDFSNEKQVCWLQWCMKTVPYKKKNEDGVEIEALTKKFTREAITDELSILQETNVTLYYVSDTDIKAIKETYPLPDLCPLVGTMAVHQIIATDEPGLIKYREVSCFCGDVRGNCSCFDIKMHRLYKRHLKNTEIQDNVTASKSFKRKKEDRDRKGSIIIEKKREYNAQSIPGTSSLLNSSKVNKMHVSQAKSTIQKQKGIKTKGKKENKPPQGNKKKYTIRFQHFRY
ncbi:hypothetical protein ACJJTC_015207 [Scirpophaga incertulas]